MPRRRETARGDGDYEVSRRRLAWNDLRPQRYPEVIVTPSDEGEVAVALARARGQGMRVALVSGGHSWVGAQLRDGGMLIDLSQLDAIEVDSARRTAAVGPGAKSGQLESALRRQGLGFPFGHSPTVAVGGFLLAGGLGWNPGAWGPACYGVSAVDLILPSGETVRASERDRPDLLWAARGAGPVFPAVVARFHLELRALPRAITATTVVFSADRLEDLADWAVELVDSAPPALEVALRVARLPGADEIAIRLAATAFADTAAEAEAVLEPVLAYARERPPLEAVGTTPTSLAQLHAFVAELFPERHRYAAEAIWSEARPADLLTTLAEHIRAAPSPLSFGTVVIWPSAAGPRSHPGAAFARLGRSFAACYAAWSDDRSDAANLAWHRTASADLGALASGYYVGETDVLDPRRARASFEPSSWERLQRLRSEVDRDRLLHPTPPAG